MGLVIDPRAHPRERCFSGRLCTPADHVLAPQLAVTVTVVAFALALGLSIACLAWGEAGRKQHQPHLRSDEEPLYALQGTPEGGRGLVAQSVKSGSKWGQWRGTRQPCLAVLGSNKETPECSYGQEF